MRRDLFSRFGVLILLAAAGLVPLLAWATLHVYKRKNNNVGQWLPQNEATGVYDDFLRWFGSDEMVLVSWRGCTLDDERLEQFARCVEGASDPGRKDGLSRLFAGVVTGPRVLAELESRPLNLSRERALDRLGGTLVGPDRKTTCAVVTLSQAGNADRAAAVEAIKEIAIDRCDVKEEDLRLSGDAVINVAIDVESENAVNQWVAVSTVLALLIAWACLRSFRLALIVFVLAEYCASLSEAVIYFAGGTMNLLLVMVPVLTYVLTISGSVHLCNYYRDALDTGPRAAAPLQAVKAGWQPCLIAAVTTAVGLASLCASRVVPVRMFGMYGAVSVMLAFAVTMFVLPAAFAVLPMVSTAGRKPPAEQEGRHPVRGLVGFLIGYRVAVVAACLGAFVVFGCGVLNIRSSVDPAKFLSPQSRWMRDTEWHRRQIGPIGSIEIVVGFDKGDAPDMLDRMRAIRNVQDRIRAMDEVPGVTSAATFAPELGKKPNAAVGARQVIRRRLFNQQLLRHRRTYIDAKYLADNGRWELWRISARVKNFDNADFSRVVDRVHRTVDQALGESGVPLRRVKIIETGAVPLVFAAQGELLRALGVSFLTACVLIGVVMVLVLRNPVAGIVAMLPNVFPAVVVFGTMGWSRVLVDVGSMMTASVALGIAVDDTMHFLAWYRRALGQGASRHEAIRLAYRQCAAAMTQTTLIAGLALVVFYFSSFQPVSQFGLLMFELLVAALVGDLIFLPALLATRAGRNFAAARRNEGPSG